jgi:hypothetical protein
MTRNAFRLLLLFYILLFILGTINIFMIEGKFIPSDIIERAKKAEFIFMDDTPFVIQVIIVAIMGLTILTGFVGFLGMLFFWSKSRYLFALAIILRILLTFSEKWGVSSSLNSFLGEFVTLLDGIIICLIFWGPAKSLFEIRKGKPNNDLQPDSNQSITMMD